MRKTPFAGIELTSQRVRGLRGTSELPGRPAVHTWLPTILAKYFVSKYKGSLHFVGFAILAPVVTTTSTMTTTTTMTTKQTSEAGPGPGARCAISFSFEVTHVPEIFASTVSRALSKKGTHTFKKGHSLPPVLSTCPLHNNNGCGKERRILIGPW